MGLHENLLRGIYAYEWLHARDTRVWYFLGSSQWIFEAECEPSGFGAGFEKPSAIQQRGIVPFTKSLDVIQQAQSGTGKTATFCAGILHQVRTPAPRGPRVAVGDFLNRTC
eukprot:4264169-Pyramimonas_sp.AAC.1